MSDNTTVTGGQTLSWNFTGSTYSAVSNAQFEELYSATATTGEGTDVAAASSSSNILYIPSGSYTAVPDGYVAVYDASTNDTIMGGESDPIYFLNNNTTLELPTSDSIVYANGDDLVMTGSGSNTVYAGSGAVSVEGGSGDLSFVGGTGSVSVYGGSGSQTLMGSTGTGTTYLQAASGNSTLYGGTGTAASTLIGGTNTTEFAEGSGTTVMVAGTGNSTIDGLTGTGNEAVYTSPISKTGTALIALNNAADTVIGGSGSATVIGGSGGDVYGFVNGYAGGSIVIEGFNASDNIAFGNYSGNPIASETVANGSDVMTLTDGTTITFVGIDHKLL